MEICMVKYFIELNRCDRPSNYFVCDTADEAVNAVSKLVEIYPNAIAWEKTVNYTKNCPATSYRHWNGHEWVKDAL